METKTISGVDLSEETGNIGHGLPHQTVLLEGEDMLMSEATSRGGNTS